MVYEGNTLDRNARTKIMDAFVVLDREAYIKLTGITPKEKAIDPIVSYQASEKNYAQLNAVTQVIESIYTKEGKTKWKWPFIRLIRSAASQKDLSQEKNWLYNQILIYLFTIDRMH